MKRHFSLAPFRLTFLLTALVLAGRVLGAGAPATPPALSTPIECRWTEKPPVIDGRSEDVWGKAERVERFVQNWIAGAPAPKETTSARLLWDRDFLYFFADLTDADITATVTEHDGPLWENDVFELFLKPSEKHPGYFQFEVNPRGAVLDAFLPAPGVFENPAQLRREEFHVEAKVQVRGTLNMSRDKDSGWSVEGRIPWSDFLPAGGRPAPGETWHVNLARQNGVAPHRELSATAPLTQPIFHRTEEYTALRFVGPEQLPRPRWENQRLVGSPDGPPKYFAEQAWPKLITRSLVTLIPAPGGEWQWFIEQHGTWEGPMKLRRMRAHGDGSDAETLMELADLVYNIAFHPRFAENGFVYFGVNGPTPQGPRHTTVLRYVVRDGKPDPTTRTEIISWPSNGHNGAGIAFANDGMLFVTSGDGTSDSDTDRVGQDTKTLRAKVLRIDVDHPAPGKTYAVPADNPFVNDARFAPETWAYGLRNPWRLAYDPVSGQLWEGENGQDTREYARLVQRGANYGWSVFEGSQPFAQDRALGPQPVTFPTVEFPHAEFRSLTGGVIYRGKKFPELVGAYVFGDFGTGRIWAAKHDGTKLEWTRELLDTPFAITHVTVDAAGELVFCDYGSPVYGVTLIGAIYRLAPAPPPATAPPEFPRLLSATGLFSDTAKMVPLAGVLPYEINAPGWHDGATSLHYLALPGNGTMEYRAAKSWQPPNGTVLAQTLTNSGRRVETRILVKQANDASAYTYVWNAAQTDAMLADKTGADIEVGNHQPWRVPSRAECLTCHTRQANFSLTLNEAQLNRGDQLARWERLGLMQVFGPGGAQPGQRTGVASSLLPAGPEKLRRFAAPNDAQAALEWRARSYLGVNCAHCHTLYGGGNSPMEFDWTMPRGAMRAIGEKPQHGDFELKDARIVAPGAVARSVLISRVSSRGRGQMPPIGTRTVDPEGLRLLAEWIQSLAK